MAVWGLCSSAIWHCVSGWLVPVVSVLLWYGTVSGWLVPVVSSARVKMIQNTVGILTPESETTTLAQDVRYHLSSEVEPQPRHRPQLHHCKSLKFTSGCFMAASLQPISATNILHKLCVQFCLQLFSAHSPMPCYHSRKMLRQYLKLSEGFLPQAFQLLIQ
jgi:hypothetical protein